MYDSLYLLAYLKNHTFKFYEFFVLVAGAPLTIVQ